MIAQRVSAAGRRLRRVLVAATATAVGATLLIAAPAPGREAAAAEPWNPPAHLVQPLAEVWSHMEDTYGDLYGFRNYGWDQLMANGDGTIHYCVRWESSVPVTAAQRDDVHESLEKQYNKWIDSVAGFDDFPYQDVEVKVVGWAVADRSTLQWQDDSVDIYAGVLDGDGAPQCAPDCGRFFNQDGDYSRCPGREERHYDQSLWLTEGFGGGAGGDWGQRIAREYFMDAVGRDEENIHILLHEMGHTWGLDDFYDWTPTGVGGFLMKAGSATEITEFDAWMLRDFWRHLKSRYEA